MGIITLVSYVVAKEGHTFVASQPSEECINCRFKSVCVDKLKPNHVYKVVKVMNIKNSCKVNERVVTVEVEEIPVEVVIPKKYAVEGLRFKYKKISCDKRCDLRNLCSTRLIADGAVVKVVEVGKRVDCLNFKEAMVKAKVILAD